MKAIVEGTTFPFTIPQGFRIAPEQFQQLAEVEQIALSGKDILPGFTLDLTEIFV